MKALEIVNSYFSGKHKIQIMQSKNQTVLFWGGPLMINYSVRIPLPAQWR